MSNEVNKNSNFNFVFLSITAGAFTLPEEKMVSIPESN